MMPARIVLVASLPALVTPAVATTTVETNKTAVLETYDQALKVGSFAVAAKCLAPRCTQDYANVADGIEDFPRSIALGREELRDAESEIKHRIADRDCVIERGREIVDICWLVNGKIAAYWHAVQLTSDKAANPNTLS
jgi:predicted SnoaL-like aldol condensation-catalyzing enzyme